MFDGITVSAIIAEATTFASELRDILLIVIGFGMFVALANWVVAKFKNRG